MLKPIKTLLNGLDGTFRLIGVGVNLTLVSAFAWATNKFYDKATSAWKDVGPIPEIDIASMTAWATDHALADRLIAMGSLWVYAIMAAGCGWMTILGVRWCYHLALAFIQHLKLQVDKVAT